ncbi:MAG: AMP-binding protein, partial [Acetobacterales bacterium]
MPLNTLHDLIDAFDDRGDAPALLSLEGEDVETWSYRDLRARIGHVAGGLKDAGVQEEHFVALVAENSPAWIVGYFAIVSLGATAVLIDHATSEKERQRLLAHAGARLALIETGDAERGAPDLRRIGDDGHIGERLAGWSTLLDSGPAEGVAVNADRVASLLYTSGTTGTPKGVPLTHGNFASNVEGLLTEDLATPGDRVVLPLPLHHAYPFTVGMLTTFAVGATLVMPERIAPEAIGRALHETDATIMVGVPRLFTALLAGIEAQVKARGTTALRLYRAMRALSLFCKRRLGIRIGRCLFRQLHSRFGPSLRLLASGGAKLEADTAWSLEALGWEVMTGYGLTETSPVVTFTPRGRPRFETAGKPLDQRLAKLKAL